MFSTRFCAAAPEAGSAPTLSVGRVSASDRYPDAQLPYIAAVILTVANVAQRDDVKYSFPLTQAAHRPAPRDSWPVYIRRGSSADRIRPSDRGAGCRVPRRSSRSRKGREWFQDQACSKDDALIAELTAPTYSFTSTGKMMVESKADMKKRGLRSPDLADAFLLTFACGERRKERYRRPEPRRRSDWAA